MWRNIRKISNYDLDIMLSLPSRNSDLAIAVKKHAKADIKLFLPRLILLDFSEQSGILLNEQIFVQFLLSFLPTSSFFDILFNLKASLRLFVNIAPNLMILCKH